MRKIKTDIENIMKCKICGQKTFIFGNATYYLADGKHYLTTTYPLAEILAAKHCTMHQEKQSQKK